MSGKKFLIILTFSVFIFQGCQQKVGSLNLCFSTSVCEEPLQMDTCKYVNRAGNKFEITDVQYFISEIILTDFENNEYELAGNSNIHYFDQKIHGTHSQIFYNIPSSNYKNIKFTFGLRGNKNVTGFFKNPPENNMSWPSILGGGYHYMKINGRWRDGNGVLQPFNLHLGKVKSDETEKYMDNTFDVILPLNNFIITEGKTSSLNLDFRIDNWFQNPNIFDFNNFGGAIMANKEAQMLLKENGKDVFFVLQ